MGNTGGEWSGHEGRGRWLIVAGEGWSWVWVERRETRLGMTAGRSGMRERMQPRSLASGEWGWEEQPTLGVTVVTHSGGDGYWRRSGCWPEGQRRRWRYEEEIEGRVEGRAVGAAMEVEESSGGLIKKNPKKKHKSKSLVTLSLPAWHIDAPHSSHLGNSGEREERASDKGRRLRPSFVRMAASKGPRYAAREDPTLPKPWRALVDGNTGFLYFWNPLTNVTQYEKPNLPNSDDATADVSLPKSEPNPNAEDKNDDDLKEQEEEKHEEEHNDDPRQQQQEEHSTEVEHEACSTHDTTYGEQMSEEPVQEHRSSDMGSRSSADAYRRQHEITVTGDVPHPFTTFVSTGFPPEILREVLRAGFSAPTPIQAQSWPIALQNRDIVAVAKTGSGKTLGYLIPGFIHLKRLQNDAKMGPRVLVLSPTRELATQIHEEAEKFGKSSRISSVCLYGGAPKGPQLRDLERGADMVIATPGRLNDILEMRRVSLHQVSYMVLDEADRMLDMGFEPQIRKIVNGIPPRRQTLMFTATWPKEVRKIAADLLVNPVQVNIGNIDELVANKSITQYIEVITPMEKRRRLEQILRTEEPNSKIIVFCSTKRMCDQLARILTNQFGAAAIHGDKSQSERDSILSQFRNGMSPVLVATDVAARGLDVKDIKVVVNYDFPTGIEDYVHRIGRTGRAGATGVAYTFFCDQDSKYASDLVKILEGASQRVPPELRNLASRSGGGGYGGGGKSRRWSSDSGGSYSGGGSRYGGDYGNGGSYGGGGSRYGGSSGYGGSNGDGSGSRYGEDSGNGGSYGGGTGNNGCDGYGDNKSAQVRNDDGPVWSHDRLMAAAAGAGVSQRQNSGTWAIGNPTRSRSPSPNVGSCKW